VKTPYLSFIAVDGSHHFTYNKTGVQEVAWLSETSLWVVPSTEWPTGLQSSAHTFCELPPHLPLSFSTYWAVHTCHVPFI
jgi:hypothetical protein